MHAKNLNVRQHAVLLCRVAGLHAAAVKASKELAGHDWTVEAMKEMERILALTQEGVRAECERISARMRAKHGFDVADGTYRSSVFFLWHQ